MAEIQEERIERLSGRSKEIGEGAVLSSPVPRESFRLHLIGGEVVDRDADQFYCELWHLFEALLCAQSDDDEQLALYRNVETIEAGPEALTVFAGYLSQALDDIGIEGPSERVQAYRATRGGTPCEPSTNS